MRNFFLFIWQLPQNIVGMVAVLVLHAGYNGGFKVFVHYKRNLSSVSLGNIVIVKYSQLKDKVIKHEQGHQKQSLYLGWLYLIVIGLPSAVGNLLFRIRWVWKHFDYYRQPWEAWADSLGGVER